MLNPVSKILIPLLSLMWLNSIAQATSAETPEEKGLRIAVEADRMDSGWESASVALHMVLISPNGQKTTREVRMQYLEGKEAGDKSLSIFDSPKDVQGTAFLSFSHALQSDEQWLYLPALKRVKRIASANKSGPFMGSEFAFEDLSSSEIEKYSYEFLRDETIDNQDCYVVRNFPQYEHSGYSHRDVWIDKKHYRVLRIEYFDRKGQLLKTLEQHGHKIYLDKYWRADKFYMANYQTGKSTELHWSDFQFGLGLSDADFNQNTLMRAR